MAERSGKSMNEVSQFRLYTLRVLYVVLGLGLGITEIPLFFHHEHWTQARAVANCFLLALACLSLVGVRSPLQMLPLLIYELLWKMIWLLGVALPLWLAHQLDADTLKSLPTIAPVVIIIPFIPWRYVFAKYLVHPSQSGPAQPGDLTRP
jgi:hypothetical protein